MIVENYLFRSDNTWYKEMQTKGYDARIMIGGEEYNVDFKCTSCGLILEMLQGNESNPKANRLFGDKEDDRLIIYVSDINAEFFYCFLSSDLKKTEIYQYYLTHTDKEIFKDTAAHKTIMGLDLIRNKYKNGEKIPGVYLKASPEWFINHNIKLLKYYPRTMEIEKVKENRQ